MQVYVNSSNVDDYLVESITRPAQDPNAGEVYYRYMNMSILYYLVSLCLYLDLRQQQMIYVLIRSRESAL